LTYINIAKCFYITTLKIKNNLLQKIVDKTLSKGIDKQRTLGPVLFCPLNELVMLNQPSEKFKVVFVKDSPEVNPSVIDNQPRRNPSLLIKGIGISFLLLSLLRANSEHAIVHNDLLFISGFFCFLFGYMVAFIQKIQNRLEHPNYQV